MLYQVCTKLNTSDNRPNTRAVGGTNNNKMNKENRIFVLGFFWLIVGGFVASMRIHGMINGTWEHLWYEWMFLVAGISCMIDGLVKIQSVTKSDGKKPNTSD